MAKITVLLVDDEKDFLNLMAVRIKSWGYELTTAETGKEAIDIVKEGGTQMMVLDYMLPEMDGVSVLREIRKFDKKLPVIMFTAYPDTHAIDETKKLGISAFIPKLSTYSEVLPALKSALDMTAKKLST